MPEWSTACLDWQDRIRRGDSLIPFEPLFPDQAREGLDVFSQLRAVDVIGAPTLGEISRKWVTDLVSAIFGAYDPDSGRRLIREVFLLISKKNAKSTNAAGIMLTALLLNWRQSGEMGILSPTIEVANNAWRPARDAIRADEELSDLLQVQDHIRTITHRQTGATLQVVAADSETVAGKKWIVTFVDELWLFGKKANADKMLLEATGGMASRPEGFVMYSSTQSDDPPAGVFREKLNYARDVRDGKVIDPAFLPVLYEFPDDIAKTDAVRNPKNFYMTNPNMGASVDEAFLVRELNKAERIGEKEVRIFLAKHLNVEIGQALRSDRWAGADFWEAQSEPGITFDTILEECDIARVGIDGGGLDDLLGLSVIGRRISDRKWVLWNRAWAHRSVLERRKSEASRFADFERDGDLVIIDNVGEDLEELASIVSDLDSRGMLGDAKTAGIGIDPGGIGGILDALADVGILEEKILGISQGWRLGGSIKTTERKLAEKIIVHGGTAMMSWCVSNAKVEPRGNAIVITKQASGYAKIDPLMATFNAVSLMATAAAQPVNVIGDDYEVMVV